MPIDWEAASAELRKKLDPAHVRGRQQGGSQVQYVEGWHAIAEMNRIFGFGSWHRETLDIRQLGEAREVNGKQRVDYMARVRITVGDVIRDGCGFGQGIDKDVGQAHESALKEAETDAMKRAMMTLGNPFGLALYDKSRENVGRDEPPAPAPDHRAMCDRVIKAVRSKTSATELTKLLDHKATQATFDDLAKAKPAMAAELRGEILQAWNKAHGGQGGPSHPFVDRLADAPTREPA